MQHQLKHYIKHKHLNLISWQLDGYVYSETIHSSFSASDDYNEIPQQSYNNATTHMFVPKWCLSIIFC